MNYLFCFPIAFFNEVGIPLNRNCFLASTTEGSSLGFGTAFINTGAILTHLSSVFLSISSSLSEDNLISFSCESKICYNFHMLLKTKHFLTA